MEMTFTDSYNARRKVLVVDDEYVNRQLLGMILSEDYEVLYAENGREALNLIRTNHETLSIIMLDLIMPQMDGFELLGLLRADEELKRIPVVVLTSEKSAELKSLKSGATDFITKPYDMPEVILTRVRRIIELSEGRSIIQAAEKDELTGLYTANFFYEYAQKLERYHPDWEMDAIAVNIDRFHLVNELYGREFGDRVLRLLARKADGSARRRSSGKAVHHGQGIFSCYRIGRAERAVLKSPYHIFFQSPGDCPRKIRILRVAWTTSWRSSGSLTVPRSRAICCAGTTANPFWYTIWRCSAARSTPKA